MTIEMSNRCKECAPVELEEGMKKQKLDHMCRRAFLDDPSTSWSTPVRYVHNASSSCTVYRFGVNRGRYHRHTKSSFVGRDQLARLDEDNANDLEQARFQMEYDFNNSLQLSLNEEMLPQPLPVKVSMKKEIKIKGNHEYEPYVKKSYFKVNTNNLTNWKKYADDSEFKSIHGLEGLTPIHSPRRPLADGSDGILDLPIYDSDIACQKDKPDEPEKITEESQPKINN